MSKNKEAYAYSVSSEQITLSVSASAFEDSLRTWQKESAEIPQ